MNDVVDVVVAEVVSDTTDVEGAVEVSSVRLALDVVERVER